MTQRDQAAEGVARANAVRPEGGTPPFAASAVGGLSCPSNFPVLASIQTPKKFLRREPGGGVG